MHLRGGSVALCAALVVAGAGCFSAVDWKNHLSFRSYGKGLHLSHVDSDELIVGRISRNLHYVSIALDSVFFRDLPGLYKRDVVFGFEIRGAGDKPIKTVLDITEAAGEHSFLSIDNAVVLQPFLYTGRNIEIILWFKSTSKDNVGNVKGRLAGAGDTLKKLNPLASSAISIAGNIFEGVIGAFVKKEQTWKYQFTLYPVDSTYRDKPELLFTAGRHILLAMPPAGAPGAYRLLKPAYLIKYLGMRGNRLVWNYNDEEFVELPYIILNITRYKRYPNNDTPLRKAIAAVERAYENQNLELARNKLKEVGGLIFEDKVITQREKNLEQLWKEFREARNEMSQAEKDKSMELQLTKILQQVKHLGDILTQFPEILEPFEIKDIDFKINRLSATYERLAKTASKDITELKQLIAKQRQAVVKARAQAKKEELNRQKLAVKYDTRKQSKTKPPPEVIAAIKDLKSAVTRFPIKKWWFWTSVAAVLGGGVGVWAATRGSDTQVMQPTGAPGIGAVGAPPAGQ